MFAQFASCYPFNLIVDTNLSFGAFLEEEVAEKPRLAPELVLSPTFAANHKLRLAQIRSLVITAKDLDIAGQDAVILEWSQDTAVQYFIDRFSDHDTECWSIVIDILSALGVYNLRPVRRVMLLEIGSVSLIKSCLNVFHQAERDEGFILQMGDFFRQIMEPSLASDTFISDVYESGFLEQFAIPVLRDTGTCFLQQTVLDVLSFFVGAHHYIAKAYFLRFGALFKALRSILLREATPSTKLVILGAIRLVRMFFWQKDQQYMKCLSAFNIPSLIFQLVHLQRPNGFLEGSMVYSACLEILTFICVNNQTGVMESLCRPGSESEEIVRILADDLYSKSHSELAQFMLSSVEKMTSNYLYSGGQDLTSRHSIGSSRGRSLSPHPLVVPMPSRKRTIDEEDEEPFSESPEELIPNTPGSSPQSELKRPRVDHES